MTHDPPRRDAPGRDPDTRSRDHDAIDRLTDEVLPDLISRLASSGLGEIEIREDDWRIRLRRPPLPARPPDRLDRPDRSADRPARPAGASNTGPDARPTRDPRDGTPLRPTTGDGNGSGPATAPDPLRVIATSPAVGVFQPRSDLRPGARVRAGDRLGAVDLLGLPQDVVAPEDGVVVDTLVGAGEGVEYGQDLVVIEPAVRGRHGQDGTAPAAPITES